MVARKFRPSTTAAEPNRGCLRASRSEGTVVLNTMIRTVALSALALACLCPARPAAGVQGRAVRLPASGPVTALPTSAKRWALVVGVEEYADRR